MDKSAAEPTVARRFVPPDMKIPNGHNEVEHPVREIQIWTASVALWKIDGPGTCNIVRSHKGSEEFRKTLQHVPRRLTEYHVHITLSE